MASLFQGSALPNITTTKTDTTSGPDWYNTYLSNLAQVGTGAMAKTPNELVAGFSPLQEAAFAGAPTAATSYQPTMSAAEQTAAQAAQGITPQSIQSFMNPYTGAVVDEMGRLSGINTQRNVMPALKSAFVGTGGLGSRRYAGATGQTMADISSNLLGAQTGALQKGYADAMAAAKDQAGLLNQAAQTQGTLASTEQKLGLAGTEALSNLGAQQQKQAQALINAPLTTAANAANIFTNLKVPTTVSSVSNAPIPGAYANSPLSQIAGLGTLFASGAGGSSSAVQNMLKAVLGEAGAATVAQKGIIGALKGSEGATGDGSTYTDQSGNPDSPVYGMTPNEDGTYSADTGAIYDRNGVLIWDPAMGSTEGDTSQLIDQSQEEYANGTWDYDSEGNPIWVSYDENI